MRKNKQDYTMMQVKKSLTEKLKEIKIHRNEPYNDIIERLIEKQGETKDE